MAKVLYFDTETTGIPDRNANWESDFQDYPHIVQLSWIAADGREEDHIIYPDGWEIPAELTEIHGISTEIAKQKGESCVGVVHLFIQDCHDAEFICGHNIHFDTSIVKANILRELGRSYYDLNEVDMALFKGKRIDTMRPAMKWVDARRADGKLKFPRLEELYARCFPGETFNAHNAMEDTRAVARCLPILLENGVLELKVKEYPPKPTENPVNGANPGLKQENDKSLDFSVQSPQIENPVQLSPEETELLNEDEDNF